MLELWELLSAPLAFIHFTHSLLNSMANFTFLDSSFQPPITCFGDFAAYLHQHLRTFNYAWDYGPQSEWVWTPPCLS